MNVYIKHEKKPLYASRANPEPVRPYHHLFNFFLQKKTAIFSINIVYLHFVKAMERVSMQTSKNIVVLLNGFSVGVFDQLDSSKNPLN